MQRKSKLNPMVATASIVVAIVALSFSASAQTPAPSTPDALQEQIKELQQRVSHGNTLFESLYWAVTFLAAVIGGTTIIAVFLTFFDYLSSRRPLHDMRNLLKSEEQSRSDERRRMDQLFEAIKRESDNSSKLFDLSKGTMSLVNEAMGYANQATKRAVSVALETATRRKLGLDQQAVEFLKNSLERFDVQRSPPEKRRLDNLVAEIKVFDIYAMQFESLEDQRKLEPSSHALFLMGLQDHYGQNYDDAIRAWEKAARVSEKQSDKIAALSLYWAGVAHNNKGGWSRLGRNGLPDAQSCFVRAKGALPPNCEIQALEIDRILLETRFFDEWADPDRLAAIIGELDNLVGQASDTTSLHRIRTTFGNVLLGSGRFDGALAQFDAVLGSDQHVGQAKIWAAFGRAQALWAKEPSSNDTREAFEKVVPLARESFQSKHEDRGRLLAAATRYICACRLGDISEAKIQRETLEGLLGPIDSNTHLYSQFVMRNIPKEEYRVAIEQFK
jgi:tetratricopeptide (TPR) repeat protein